MERILFPNSCSIFITKDPSTLWSASVPSCPVPSRHFGNKSPPNDSMRNPEEGRLNGLPGKKAKTGKQRDVAQRVTAIIADLLVS